jgi:hypothetical protein
MFGRGGAIGYGDEKTEHGTIPEMDKPGERREVI